MSYLGKKSTERGMREIEKEKEKACGKECPETVLKNSPFAANKEL